MDRSPLQSIPFHEHASPVNISRKIVPCLVSPWFTLALAVMILVTYGLDLITPLGVPVWLLYFVPLFLSFWSKPYYALPTVSAVSMLFLVAGFVFSPLGIQTSTALVMRAVFSVVFISISVVLWMMRRRMRRNEKNLCIRL